MVEHILLDLQDLYRYGGPDVRACDILGELLKLYNIEGLLVYNYSPDVGDEILLRDGEFIKDIENAESREDVVKAVEKLARKLGATAIVELFDGYERAFAVVFEKE